MTTYIASSPQPETETEIFYPSSDGEPVAETYDLSVPMLKNKQG
jgi:hypothetical protein